VAVRTGKELDRVFGPDFNIPVLFVGQVEGLGREQRINLAVSARVVLGGSGKCYAEQQGDQGYSELHARDCSTGYPMAAGKNMGIGSMILVLLGVWLAYWLLKQASPATWGKSISDTLKGIGETFNGINSEQFPDASRWVSTLGEDVKAWPNYIFGSQADQEAANDPAPVNVLIASEVQGDPDLTAVDLANPVTAAKYAYQYESGTLAGTGDGPSGSDVLDWAFANRLF
jgi:hypothetical protein